MIIYDRVGGWYRVIKTYRKKTDIKPNKVIKLPFSTLTKNGVLYLKKGYCWDGATYAKDTKNAMDPSAVHDFFCYAYDLKLITKEQRKLSDKLFKQDLLDNKVNRFRVAYMYEAVRKFFEIRH